MIPKILWMDLINPLLIMKFPIIIVSTKIVLVYKSPKNKIIHKSNLRTVVLYQLVVRILKLLRKMLIQIMKLVRNLSKIKYQMLIRLNKIMIVNFFPLKIEIFHYLLHKIILLYYIKKNSLNS
jgi:hypothetical protein